MKIWLEQSDKKNLEYKMEDDNDTDISLAKNDIERDISG